MLKESYLRIVQSNKKFQNLIYGFSIGIISISSYYFFLTILDFFSLDISRLNYLLVIETLIVSFFIAFSEEIIFRDFLFNSFKKKI